MVPPFGHKLRLLIASSSRSGAKIKGSFHLWRCGNFPVFMPFPTVIGIFIRKNGRPSSESISYRCFSDLLISLDLSLARQSPVIALQSSENRFRFPFAQSCQRWVHFKVRGGLRNEEYAQGCVDHVYHRNSKFDTAISQTFPLPRVTSAGTIIDFSSTFFFFPHR